MAYIGNDLKVAYSSYTNIDDISGSFNGSTTSFALLVNGAAPVPLPLRSNQCLISVGGVVQRPDDSGAEGFRLSGGNIIFSSAPTTGEDFFGVILAGADYVNAGANFPDGTVGAPSITFDQDNDTGYYRSGSGAVGFTSNGVASGTWSSAGVTAPSLIPSGSTVPTNGVYLPAANSVGIATNSTHRVRIDSSGNVGIGTTSVSGGQLVINSTLDASNKQLVLRDAINGWARKIGVDSSNNMGFYDGDTERMRIDSSGRLLVGTSTARSNFFNLSLFTPQVQLEGVGGAGQQMMSVVSGDTVYPSYIILARQKSGTIGGNTVVASGDPLGEIVFQGSDGTDFVNSAVIKAEVDGTPGANDMPGRLIFATTADGASSPTERMRISNTGATSFTADAAATWAYVFKNDGNSTNRYGLDIWCGAYNAAGTNYAIDIRDGDGGEQGFVTFSGGTVTYGAFTAHHLCILPDEDNETGYAYGTLVEITALDYSKKNGVPTERGIRYKVRKTQSFNSRAVLGAYGSSMNDGPSAETNLHQALVLGDGHILCNGSGGNLKVGDGICSSAVAGIGQKATAVPSMVIGIAQEDVTFDGDELKLVAVQYGLHQFIPWQE